MEEITFRISSGLKNIIGKELITDEMAAVFELVKNSFDADATKVEIIFEDQTDLSLGKITIKDNGKGMNEDDLKKKWLFVAYSAKREGTEIDEDYRNRIKVNRVFAGAKGVGRFSCDRLGKKLDLKSVKDEDNSKIENLIVNWEDFEVDAKNEFINVKIKHQTLGKSTNNGTTLEITGLRDVWDRPRLLRLKKSLAKLINPSQGNDSDNFKIKLLASSELAEDKKVVHEYDQVNGFIQNDVFENLKIKTTSLSVEISEDGNTITSTLQDRGDRIYTLVEKNPYSDFLHSVSFHLFQLNRAAKLSFTRIMGLSSPEYGSIFMYKNGFRIYPFGEPGEDILAINRRKQQGYNRFLGTRDLIGRIEINGENKELRETSSRDRGLEKTATYDKLVECFYDFVLRRLENYVVNVIKWGDEKINEETGELVHPELWPKDVKIQILEVITGFIKSENVISIDYDNDFLKIIDSKQDKSVDKIIRNISKIGSSSKSPAIVKEADRIGKAVGQIRSDAARDRKRADEAEQKAQKTGEILKYTIGQNYFLKAAVGTDTKEVLSLLHHIDHSTNRISDRIEGLIKSIKRNEDPQTLLSYIKTISLENIKIAAFSRYYKRTNFDAEVVKINKDLVGFISEYLENVYKTYEHLKFSHLNPHITIEAPKDIEFIRKFRPIEITILVDNFLHNSTKAKAKNVIFRWVKKSELEVSLHVIDDGKGISTDAIPNIFDFGYTTTDGSGLGLYHVSEIVKEMGGQIEINSKIEKGAEFVITFKK